MTEKTENLEATQASETEKGPNLALNDLAAAIRIIDVCSKRGAFEGNELTQVGTLRERLVAFLEANAPKKPEGETDSEAEEKAAE